MCKCRLSHQVWFDSYRFHVCQSKSTVKPDKASFAQDYQSSHSERIYRLTNVSVVRLKKGGKRFEVGRNVQEWRSGVEKDLYNVLQISNVFANVSKGEVANANDIKKAFNKTDTDAVVIEILQKGELQVGEKERAHNQSSLWKEIATLVAEKAVNPETQTPYSVGLIEKAMSESGFSIKTDKSGKSQVSACIKHMQDHSKLPIQRARMRLRVTLPVDVEDLDQHKKELAGLVEKVENEYSNDTTWQAIVLIEPSEFRNLGNWLHKVAKDDGRLETLSFAATAKITEQL